MKTYQCTLGGRVRNIKADTEQHARKEFQRTQRMWSNSIRVVDLEELQEEQY